MSDARNTFANAQADVQRRRQCGFRFTRYQPSVYEEQWLRRVAGNPHCRGLMPDADGVRDWLEARGCVKPLSTERMRARIQALLYSVLGAAGRSVTEK